MNEETGWGVFVLFILVIIGVWVWNLYSQNVELKKIVHRCSSTVMEANENIDIANVWISEGKDSTRDYYGMLNSIEQMDEVEEVSNPCIVPN